MAPKGKKSLYDQVNALDAAFASQVFAMSDDALRNKLIELAKYEEELLNAKEQDPDLSSARQALQTALSAYSQPLKASRLKRKLILQILTERGKI